MDITPKHLSSFDKYYEGRMSLEEQVNFEIALHSDSSLHNAFCEYMNIAIGIHIHAAAQEPVKATPIIAKPLTTSQKLFTFKRHLFLAAAVFLVCTLAYPIYQDYTMLNNMPHHFGRQANKPMGNPTIKQSLFNEGLVLRDNEQYTAAAQKFEQIEKTSDYYDNARFEKALIYLKERNYVAANAILEDIAANSEKEALRKKAKAVQKEVATIWFWL